MRFFNFKKGFLIFMAEMLIFQPFVPLLKTQLASAAESEEKAAIIGDVDCYSTAKNYYSGGDFTANEVYAQSGVENDSNDAAEDYVGDPGDETPFSQIIDLTSIRTDTSNKLVSQKQRDYVTSQDYIKKVLKRYGDGAAYYKFNDTQDYIVVCDSTKYLSVEQFDPLFTYTPELLDVLFTIQNYEAKIDFENPLDYYALVGEKCSGGLVSSLINTNKNPCQTFDTADDVFPNGEWDAPKVDVRILRTLVYLVTPTTLGGAGREYIKVKKITQYGDDNELNLPKETSTSGTTGLYKYKDYLSKIFGIPKAQAAEVDLDETVTGNGSDYSNTDTSSDSVFSNLPSTLATPSSSTQDKESFHIINRDDPPYKPKTIAKAFQISEIDKLRVGTKIVQHHSWYSETTYQYQAPFPIKVAWQTDAGQEAEPAPDLSGLTLLGNMRYNANRLIVEALDSAGLGDLEIDYSDVDVTNYNGMAEVVGQSLLEKLLGTSKGSLKGWDFQSTMEGLGRAYIEKDLGLASGALAEGDDFDSIVQNIGRVTIEKGLGLATNSLKTSNGALPDLYASIGRRYLETNVFLVREGSLSPSSGFSISTVGDILERLGEGRLETVLKLPKQSLRVKDYDKFRNSSYKASLLFPSSKTPAAEDVAMHNYIEEKLNLAYQEYVYNGVGTGSSMYGFKEADFTNPVMTLQRDQSAAALKKFKQIIGSRVIENSVGVFQNGGVSSLITTEKVQTFNVRLPGEIGLTTACNNGGKVYYKTTPDSSNTVTEGKTDDGYMIVNCGDSTVASSSYDTQILQTLQSVLINPAVVLQKVINKQSKDAPTRKENESEEDFNARLYAFYVKTATEIPINDIESNIAQSASTDTAATSTSMTSVRAYLNSSELFKDDSYFKSRLDMVNALINAQIAGKVFDLDSIKNLSKDAVNDKVIDWLNLIIAHPSRANNAINYFDEYGKSENNGWLFILNDLKERVSCAAQGGQYIPNNDDKVFYCANKVKSISAEEGQKLTEVQKYLDELTSQFNSIMVSYLSILERGGSVTNADLAGNTISGQSMMSAAVGLAGQMYGFDDNGKINKGEVIYYKDPIRSLVAPSFNTSGTVDLGATIANIGLANASGGDIYSSYLRQIGRVVIAQKISSDPLTQYQLANELNDTIVSDINSSLEEFNRLGLSVTKLNGLNLTKEDFVRIFKQGLANKAFERVGKSELARTLWDKSNTTKKVESSYNSEISNDISRMAQDYNFYADRINDVDTKSGELDKKLETLSNLLEADAASLKDELRQAKDALKAQKQSSLNSPNKNNGVIENTQDISIAYEPAINHIDSVVESITAKDGSGKYANLISEINILVSAIQQDLEEIAAGKVLPSNNGSSSSSKTNQDSTSCFDDSMLMKVFTASKISNPQTIDTKFASGVGAKIVDFSVYVGTCEVSKNLGLPNSSLYNWKILNDRDYPAANASKKADDDSLYDDTGKLKDGVPNWKKNSWNVDSLRVAVGIPSLADKHLTIENLDKLSYSEIKSLADRGKEVLQATALAKLSRLIPGFNSLLNSEKITDQDLTQIFLGNMQPLIKKVGGGIIDRTFNFPAGTGSELLVPTCHDTDGKVAACDGLSGPGTNPDNVRVQVLASVGLQKLGLKIPNFPKYFSFLSGGNMLQNWGNAQVTENSTLKENSFIGKITDPESVLRKNNTVSDLMSTFGISKTIFQSNLESLVNSIVGAINQVQIPQSKSGTLSSDDPFWGYQSSRQDLINQIISAKDNFIKETSIDELANSSSPYWSNASDQIGASSTQLAQTDLNKYALDDSSALNKIWKLLTSDQLSKAGISEADFSTKLRKMLVDGSLLSGVSIKDSSTLDYGASKINTGAAQDITTYLSSIQSDYQSYVLRIRNFTKSFETQYSLASGKYKEFMTGQINAEDISENIGKSDTTKRFLGEFVDKWISENGPEWLKIANNGLKALTKTINCTSATDSGQGQGFGEILYTAFDTKNNLTSSCSIKGLGQITGKDLLYGSSDAQKQFRQYVFDNFLASTFSADMEKGLGIDRGTFRAMATDPSRFGQIALTQGLKSVANSLFGEKNYSATGCWENKIKAAFKEAFLAGFYNTETKQYEVNYKPSRSLDALNSRLNAEIDYQLGKISREYLGTSITRADLSLILQGDGRGFTFLALQYSAFTINEQLMANSSTKSHKRVHDFFITYDDIRAASGLSLAGTDYVQEIKQANIEGQIQAKVNILCSNTDPNPFNVIASSSAVNSLTSKYAATSGAYSYCEKYKGMTDAEIDAAYSELRKGVNAVYDKAAIIQGGLISAKTKEKLIRKEADERLKYKYLDAIAFMADQNIPKDFSRRIIVGDGVSRTSALTEYAFNILASNNKQFRDFCDSIGVDPGDVGGFVSGLAHALTSSDRATAFKQLFDTKGTIINNLDTAFGNMFSNIFGVQEDGRFSGLFKGLLGWAKSGFTNDGFNNSKYSNDSSTLNKIVVDVGINLACEWGDHAFGFAKGTTAKMVKIYEAYTSLMKLMQKGGIVGWSNLISVLGKNTDMAKELQNLTTGLFDLAKEFLLNDILGSTLNSIDSDLGLPQGMMSAILGAGLTIWASSIGLIGTLGPWGLVGLGIGILMVAIFGVIKVTTKTLATGDGYYPFYEYGRGKGNAVDTVPDWSENPESTKSVDPPVGTFDPTVSKSYSEGLKKAARGKIVGLLNDLATMPTSKWAKNNGFTVKDLYIGQVLTYADDSYSPLNDAALSATLNGDTPYDSSTGSGYGDSSKKCEEVVVMDDSTASTSSDGLANDPNSVCVRKEGQYAGFMPALNNAAMLKMIYIGF